MGKCPESPNGKHAWQTVWTCGIGTPSHRHDSARGCRYMYTCQYCGEPGYPIPAELADADK